MRKWKVRLSLVGINITVEAEAIIKKEAKEKCNGMMVDLLLKYDLIHESLIPPRPFVYPM